MKDRWVRNAAALVMSTRDAVTVVSPSGEARRFSDASGDLVRAALDFWATAHTEAELVDHLRLLAGECDPALVADTRACLQAAGAIGVAPAPAVAASRAPSTASARARVVVGVSGAVAATDVPALVRMLLSRGLEVAVAMTPSSRRFVSADALEAITHRPVVRGFWQRHEGGPAPHIQLATWADLVVLYPASAATIARVATGLCSDVVAATVAATRAPVLVVPSMNDAMYTSPAVRRNLEVLREDGRAIVYPGTGVEVAWHPSARTPVLGAAPPPARVVAAIELLLKDAPARVAPVDWDQPYAGALADLPWFTEALDADVAAVLGTLGNGRLLDVGTGPGTSAIFAARAGFEVVATDVSRGALEAARERAGGGGVAITWVVDDATDSRVLGPFDVVVDRGCLHCLPRAAWSRYASTVAAWLRPGGLLVLKLHAPEESARFGTTPASEAELRELLAAHFDVASALASTFGGTVRPAPKALLLVLVRKEAPLPLPLYRARTT